MCLLFIHSSLCQSKQAKKKQRKQLCVLYLMSRYLCCLNAYNTLRLGFCIFYFMNIKYCINVSFSAVRNCIILSLKFTMQCTQSWYKVSRLSNEKLTVYRKLWCSKKKGGEVLKDVQFLGSNKIETIWSI